MFPVQSVCQSHDWQLLLWITPFICIYFKVLLIKKHLWKLIKTIMWWCVWSTCKHLPAASHWKLAAVRSLIVRNTAADSDLWPKIVRNQTTQPWQWRQMLARGCPMLKGAANQSGSGANNGKNKLQEGLLSITELPVLLMSTGAPPALESLWGLTSVLGDYDADPRQKQKDHPQANS